MAVLLKICHTLFKLLILFGILFSCRIPSFSSSASSCQSVARSSVGAEAIVLALARAASAISYTFNAFYRIGPAWLHGRRQTRQKMSTSFLFERADGEAAAVLLIHLILLLFSFSGEVHCTARGRLHALTQCQSIAQHGRFQFDCILCELDSSTFYIAAKLRWRSKINTNTHTQKK